MGNCSAKVVVVGSISVDIAIRCDFFPSGCSAVAGSGFSCSLTGSGANQAVQAALCGCEVYLVGKVGDDVFGKMARDILVNSGVNCDFVFSVPAISTGVSVSFVDSQGENRSCVSAGANKALSRSDIEGEAFEHLISSADVCMVNADIGSQTVSSIIRVCNLVRTRVIIDPQISKEQFENGSDLPMDYYSADIIVPSFVEAAELSQSQSHDVHSAKMVGSDLLARGVRGVVIKLGKRGAVVVDKTGVNHVMAFDVNFVDHAGCGDAFNGALAACCAVGDSLNESVKFASAAGALACSKFGVQEALPKKEEIIELLQSLS